MKNNEKCILSYFKYFVYICYFAEESGIEASQSGGQKALVHVVEVGKAGARRKALLHEGEHARHARALQLAEYLTALEERRHHLQVGLHAAHKVGAGRAELVEQTAQLHAKLAADTGEVELAGTLLDGVRVGVEESADERVGALLLDEEGEAGVERVVVLLDELSGGVDDAAGEVAHEEALVVA